MGIYIPPLSALEIGEYFEEAASSVRRRFPKILHEQGAEFNEVFNFILQDSYMQPHLHPSEDKIECIYIVKGVAAVLFFDDLGSVTDCKILENDGCEFIRIPAFVWHTYVMLSDQVITYETMKGVYHPNTWKENSGWAPLENTKDASVYLERLRSKVIRSV
jgi:cupin fold WbuC family metalloprotein